MQTSYTYEPFGNSTASGQSSTSSYQFTGRENDGTGLDYYRARYYTPTFQRFLSEDQMGLGAGDPNLYEYAGGAPTDAIDPSGNFIQVIAAGCLVGATIAGFVDDIKLANAERKGRQGPSFGQFVGDIVKGCVTGAVIAAVAVVAEVAGAWVGGEIADAAGDSAFLYRGVAEDHPGFPNALNGTAEPLGGPASAAEHNAGWTESPYTSWTTNIKVARGYAGPNGVVMQIPNAPGDGYSLVASPDKYDESEVLVQGVVKNAKVLR